MPALQQTEAARCRTASQAGGRDGEQPAGGGFLAAGLLHLAAGPHCGRRFNQKAAERHIPSCATTSARPKFLKAGSVRGVLSFHSASHALCTSSHPGPCPVQLVAQARAHRNPATCRATEAPAWWSAPGQGRAGCWGRLMQQGVYQWAHGASGVHPPAPVLHGCIEAPEDINTHA
ncbi:uncharacterized protein HaLaN_05277 [Haematococcus lacustris]|uniref:C2HC/C3H-type domain-containing protein n=1 Tax=Haematococcus lacustris TaxID=44745 RepID=A0A699YT98_HAELA|nr:uncharacterized protein HaLaN_05277 [Haematococcus lacustris]